MSLKLHVLRHGQAIHNLLADTQQKSGTAGDDVFDPELTDLGKQQAVQAGVPPELHGGVQFWVSPLKRCLQTGCLALPKTDFWHVYEDLRETAGEKLCDSRMKKTDLVAYATTQFPHVQRWDFSGVYTEEDELVKQIRESAIQMAERVRSALRRMFEIAADRQIGQFAWVSHSAYLSMLFAVLDVLPVDNRWLRNGQWQTLNLQVSDTLQKVNQRIDPFIRPKLMPPPSPPIGVSGDAATPYKLTAVDWRGLATITAEYKTCPQNERIAVWTFNGHLSQLFANSEPRGPALSVAMYPLAVKKGPVEVPNEITQGVKMWQSKMDFSFRPPVKPYTTPYVHNGVKSLRSMPQHSTFPISFEAIGLTAFTDCVLLGFLVDGLVADEIIDGAIKTACGLLDRGAMYTVTLIFCETVVDLAIAAPSQ